MMRTYMYYLRRTMTRLFYATGIYFVIACVVSGLILFGEFGLTYLTLIGGDASVNQEAFNGTSQQISAFLGDGFFSAGKLLIFAVWGLLGLMFYSIYYIISNAKIVVANEKTANDYYLQHGTTPAAIKQRVTTKVRWAVAYFAFLIISLVLLLGVWMDAVRAYMAAGLPLDMVHYALFGVGGLILNVYLVIMLALVLWRFEESV